MPSLSVPMNTICDATFVAQNKKLPIEWQQPQGDPEGDQYRDSFEVGDRMCIPGIGCYFWAASTNKLHVDTAKDVGGSMKDFCHSMLDGFKSAVDVWRSMVRLKDLKIAAVSAIGTPGCLDGPAILSNLKNMSLPAAMGNEKKWRDAVATGLSDCWDEWASKVTIPGLPWYPAYAAFPSPVAPPMPNIPMPAIACVSAGMAKMTPTMLQSAMLDAFDLDDPDGQFDACALAIGTAAAAAFTAWLPSQQVMNCMGMGNIPSWTPLSPAGPVVMGNNMPTAPGVFAV